MWFQMDKTSWCGGMVARGRQGCGSRKLSAQVLNYLREGTVIVRLWALKLCPPW